MPEGYLSTPDKERIVEGRKEGMPRQDVARLLGCTPKTVSLVMAKMNASGNVDRCRKKGRPRFTTKNEDRFLTGAFKKDPNLTLNSHSWSHSFQANSNKNISRLHLASTLASSSIVY
ncbi:unnamed protein product, partial [Mesorhabditis belari]|uniref:Transposase IS30-like HTH domain-containing protein n=1 Tax=Mesorhabditis belari TaxID=2138241 RepID=A0AAF3F172_9BILA